MVHSNFDWILQDNSSLRSVIDKPPIGGKELVPLTSVQLSGFRLHPNVPVSRFYNRNMFLKLTQVSKPFFSFLRNIASSIQHPRVNTRRRTKSINTTITLRKTCRQANNPVIPMRRSTKRANTTTRSEKRGRRKRSARSNRSTVQTIRQVRW